MLPLFAPVVDVFALYGVLFRDPVQAAGVWLGFLVVQLVCAGYALRLDGERLRTLWSMPFQLFVYRQLMYLVVIQSVVAAAARQPAEVAPHAALRHGRRSSSAAADVVYTSLTTD